MTIERHYKTSEVAELLSLNPETVLKYAQRGDLRSVRIGNDRRYPESAVREWLAQCADGGAQKAQIVPLRDIIDAPRQRRRR